MMNKSEKHYANMIAGFKPSPKKHYKKCELDQHKELIKQMIIDGAYLKEIASKLDCTEGTLSKYLNVTWGTDYRQKFMQDDGKETFPNNNLR